MVSLGEKYHFDPKIWGQWMRMLGFVERALLKAVPVS